MDEDVLALARKALQDGDANALVKLIGIVARSSSGGKASESEFEQDPPVVIRVDGSVGLDSEHSFNVPRDFDYLLQGISVFLGEPCGTLRLREHYHSVVLSLVDHCRVRVVHPFSGRVIADLPVKQLLRRYEDAAGTAPAIRFPFPADDAYVLHRGVVARVQVFGKPPELPIEVVLHVRRRPVVVGPSR